METLLSRRGGVVKVHWTAASVNTLGGVAGAAGLHWIPMSTVSGFSSVRAVSSSRDRARTEQFAMASRFVKIKFSLQRARIPPSRLEVVDKNRASVWR